MKKLAAILMALLLCMIISAALSEVPSDEAFRELNHKIWEANTFDSVISGHENYTIHWFNDYISTDAFVYQTKEELYSEWSSGQIEYNRQDCFGCNVYFDKDSGKNIVQAFVDVGPSVQLHVQQSTDEEAESFDFEHDTLKDVVYKDNLIYIYSEYDEELSRSFFEGWFGMENPGMVVTTEEIVSAETLECLAFYYRGEKDGKTVVLAHLELAYDVSEPAGYRILRALLEADSPNMKTVRYIVQPDTDEEKTYEITLPANLPCALYATGVDTYISFSDREATQIIIPDRLTDSTFYVFFNPDDELLERHTTLLQQLGE